MVRVLRRMFLARGYSMYFDEPQTGAPAGDQPAAPSEDGSAPAAAPSEGGDAPAGDQPAA